MVKFNRQEAFAKLDSKEKSALESYENGLNEAFDRSGISSKERKEMYDILMDFRVCYMCMEHYKERYNSQADKVQYLIDHPYKGTDYKKSAEYANKYSSECAVLQNLEAQYEKYRSIKISMDNAARNADETLDVRLAERGYGDEPAKGPKNGPSIQQIPQSKKR